MSRYGGQETWQAIAAMLAGRLERFSRCPGHPDPGEFDERCEHCLDHAVYRMWQQKNHSTRPVRSSGSDGMWTTAEVAAFMGISRARVHQLAQAYPEELPTSDYRAGVRLWAEDEWRAFSLKPRRSGRRPKNQP